ncbi:RagB/SusD family nutrient uptake outer membrane protein [Chitinophaga arvensicola]|uniref:Starch-binding associating with outer membrane n=1 Tax=Chitinophaga arvensicola TaxID=29529 RepID=A0A1I0RSR5_9BACT|nr:RagB/SusD family nutrient uptake outer membrane protein [Chitinophaga arvensicola]SEW44405.1 Starch-binding associating with outer membrane [Chitinophaga arvensicola]
MMIKQQYKNLINGLIALGGAMLLVSSCKHAFLDVTPDNIATVDLAFNSAAEAEKYLFTCYSYLPADGDVQSNPAFMGADEMWMEYPTVRISSYVWNIGRGNQNKATPYINTWSSDASYYRAIRDCNVFLEQVKDPAKIPDLRVDMRTRWTAEVQFLKAYYHYLLLRQYGPVVIADKNLPIDAPIDQMRVKRAPIDSVVNYIAGLLDTAILKLPERIQNNATEMGRITGVIAKAVKAQLLTMAASPLFNGNPDYSGFKDKDGLPLFNTAYQVEKWQRAADACKEAVTAAEAIGVKLYEFPANSEFNITDTTRIQMSLRGAVSEPLNSEVIWPLTNSFTVALQAFSMAHTDPEQSTNTGSIAVMAPTLKLVNLFYTQNGVPVGEDKTLNFSSPGQLRTGVTAEKYNIIENYQTARINFDREPRFYSSLGFDGGIWYMTNSPSNSDDDTWNLQTKKGQFGSGLNIPVTGYYPKKLVNRKFIWQASNAVYIENYAWPEIRLADLYLLYAETLNEAQGPVATVQEYVNKVRQRAGLKTVATSWTQYSSNPAKFTTKDGMRAIIHQERGIELAFEGQRFWDLRRWKEAGVQLNGNIQGWDTNQSDANLYYKPVTFFSQRFVVPRDYLWPISEADIRVNPNLVQNPGW